MIKPHGKILINRVLPKADSDKIIENQNSFVKLKLDKEQTKDVENIARGVYSPLEGFLREEDFKNVLNNMRLQNGTTWPIPIVLDISEKDKNRIKNEENIILADLNDNPVATLKDIQIYSYDKNSFAENVFGTLDQNHPGVKNIYDMKKYLIGGEIGLLNNRKKIFSEFNFSPSETREIFKKNRWDTIVAFQTRNVPHRGHEFLQKYALRNIDGLFVQPVIGEKKMEDFKDEYILASYKLLIEKHYPQNRVFLGILPLKMRYAGPKEAVFHAIIRKNFGCTHFIIGRDHAGVGNYYSRFAAQEIFDQFDNNEIEIEVLKYPEVVYNNKKKSTNL